MTNVKINLDLCKTVVDHTAILLLGYLTELQKTNKTGTRAKQKEFADFLNTSVYKVSTALKILEREKLITIDQKRDTETITRGVPSCVYKVL